MSTEKILPLNVNERRILGVLVEKAKTTPDAYPMTINALVTGSNQKSNRDPVLSLEDLDVEDALASCAKKGLTIRITGSGRVEKWRHDLYEAWTHDKVEMAILGELLLRGPQTEGELRGRASRMDPIADLDTLRNILRSMATRKLVLYLTPEGRRGTMVTHGFHEPAELERLRGRFANSVVEDDAPVAVVARPAPVAVAPPSPPTPPQWEKPLQEALAELTRLRGEVTDLQQRVSSLTDQLREVRQGLGL